MEVKFSVLSNCPLGFHVTFLVLFFFPPELRILMQLYLSSFRLLIYSPPPFSLASFREKKIELFCGFVEIKKITLKNIF